jgi:hypothetical protein
MPKKTVTLYVNDPMGRRCEMNLRSARMVADETGVELKVVRITSEEYAAMENKPPCPSVAVGDRLIVENGTVGYDELKAETLKN